MSFLNKIHKDLVACLIQKSYSILIDIINDIAEKTSLSDSTHVFS